MWIGLLSSLLCLAILSAVIGAVQIPLSSLWSILRETLGFSSTEVDEVHKIVLLNIRIPRTLMAILVGAALSTSGALMQSLFRNPLADPGLVGVSSGAALGAALVIVLGISITGFGLYLLPIVAFIGGLITTLVVIRLSYIGNRTVVANMLLAGIAINAIAGAGTGLLIYIADDAQLRSLSFWTLGSLGGASWSTVKIVFFFAFIPGILSIFLSRSLNIMLLGESEAHLLGINIERLKKIIVVMVCIMVGTCVSLTGMIGFVGLVVPHLCRLMLGSDNRKVIPGSLVLGASILLGSDLISRIVVAPAELPIGIVTSIIGGPFFLALLAKSKKDGVW